MQLAEIKMHQRIADSDFPRVVKRVFKAYPIDVLIKCACQVTGITVESYSKKNRKRSVVDARRLVSVYLRSNTSYSLEFIGNLTGSRLHCSVLNDYVSFNALRDSKDRNWMNTELNFIGLLMEYSLDYSTFMNPVTKLKDAN